MEEYVLAVLLVCGVLFTSGAMGVRNSNLLRTMYMALAIAVCLAMIFQAELILCPSAQTHICQEKE